MAGIEHSNLRRRVIAELERERSAKGLQSFSSPRFIMSFWREYHHRKALHVCLKLAPRQIEQPVSTGPIFIAVLAWDPRGAGKWR
jgi:hypothetical protein